MNDSGRRGLICITLLLFVLIGSGIVQAATYPDEDTAINPANGEVSPADTTDARQTVLGQPMVGETVAYRGSESAFSVAYNPMFVLYVLGAVIVVAGAYYIIRRYRRKNAP